MLGYVAVAKKYLKCFVGNISFHSRQILYKATVFNLFIFNAEVV